MCDAFGVQVCKLNYLETVCVTSCLQSPDMPQWQNDYMRGTGMEMYTEYLSAAFVGMSFPEAAE